LLARWRLVSRASDGLARKGTLEAVNVVPRVTTPLSAADAAVAVVRAYHELFGQDPTKRALVSMLSLVWIETAQGTQVKNNNFGNISASRSFGGDAWRPPWFDFDGGTAITEQNISLHERMLKGQAPEAFRAYPTREAGALDFVRQLRGSFPEVLAAAELGDADAFRVALSQKYSHDYRDTRATKTLQSFFDDFNRRIVSPPGEDIERPPGAPRTIVPVLVALGIVGVAGAIFYFTLSPPRLSLSRGYPGSSRVPVARKVAA
jgi:hypothetical protein